MSEITENKKYDIHVYEDYSGEYLPVEEVEKLINGLLEELDSAEDEDPCNPGWLNGLDVARMYLLDKEGE